MVLYHTLLPPNVNTVVPSLKDDDGLAALPTCYLEVLGMDTRATMLTADPRIL